MDAQTILDILSNDDSYEQNEVRQEVSRLVRSGKKGNIAFCMRLINQNLKALSTASATEQHRRVLIETALEAVKALLSQKSNVHVSELLRAYSNIIQRMVEAKEVSTLLTCLVTAI